MSIKQHINSSRTITGILEAINFTGVIVGAITACVVLIAGTSGGGGGALARGLCLVLTFLWWFFNKLAYVGLQLLTDITELLNNNKAATT